MKRGQYITSMSRLSKELDLTSRQLRTAISRLKKTKEINLKTTNKFTLFSICNYESFQFEDIRTNATILTESHNDTYYNDCISSDIWIEQLCINQSLEKETVKKSIKKFNDYINLTNDYKPNLRKYKSHFVNWIKYNIKTIEKSSGSYQWKWKGQAVKNGSKKDLEKDKKIFDKLGFDFKILKDGN